MERYGIILAGGLGSRLHPSTLVVNKQLMPVYDKPMIYYPLTTLMLSEIRDILIITSPQDAHLFEKLIGDGSQWGLNIQYAIQPKPEGLAQAFLIGESFIKNKNSALILGDNIFYGDNIASTLSSATKKEDGATIFTYEVSNTEHYGVANLDDDGNLESIEEKPLNPTSNLAITGLYLYDETVVERVKSQAPSKRGELEITDLNATYLEDGKLHLEKLEHGFIWIDTGSHDNLFDASQFVAIVERRQGLKIACPEEIAYKSGWIDEEMIEEICSKYSDNSYKSYLLKLIN